MRMKEQFEWVQSWSDEADKDDRPRVLLVGDSITRGYESFVREALRGVCYVDYFATSYAADTAMYRTLLLSFAVDCPYELIHFNHGLHGKHLTREEYAQAVEGLLRQLHPLKGLLLATTTFVRRMYTQEPDETWAEKVAERNAALREIAKRLDCPVNDLYTLSRAMPPEEYSFDGVHYEAAGYRRLGERVAQCVREQLGGCR